MKNKKLRLIGKELDRISNEMLYSIDDILICCKHMKDRELQMVATENAERLLKKLRNECDELDRCVSEIRIKD